MSLAWSMDKVGPLCRSAEDCAMVYSIIHGKDSLDATTYAAPFTFDVDRKPMDIRVGILQEDIMADTSTGATNLRRMLAVLDSLHITPIEKKLPSNFPFEAFDIILRSESGAFFDELVRSGAVDEMVEQDKKSRANSLRQSRFIPAVEYLQANRHRTRLIAEMDQLMSDIDVLISPASAKNQLVITNLTGHPALSIPTGLDSLNHPTSMTLIGKLFGEGKLIELGHALQEETNFHEMLPPLFEPELSSEIN
jgi:Asp-tRNA(Asn)/Glu-tRNA(Gln) amidotransferase A subunit family amidase